MDQARREQRIRPRRSRFAFPRPTATRRPGDSVEPESSGGRVLALLRERGERGVGVDDLSTLRLRSADHLRDVVGNLRRHRLKIELAGAQRWRLLEDS